MYLLQKLVAAFADNTPSQSSHIHTLHDAASSRASAAGEPLKEAHLQPVAVQVIQAIAEAVRSRMLVADTHAEGAINGRAKIDCSLLSERVHEWPYVVSACARCTSSNISV